MKKLLLAALCLLTLSGCGYNMLERQVFPLCISLDLEADGRYTVGVQAPESAAAGAKPVYDLLTATGASPEEALDLLSASTPFPLNFCQVRQCLVSYELGCQQPLRAPATRWSTSSIRASSSASQPLWWWIPATNERCAP